MVFGQILTMITLCFKNKKQESRLLAFLVQSEVPTVSEEITHKVEAKGFLMGALLS